MQPQGFFKAANVFSSPSNPTILIMNIDIGNGSQKQLTLKRLDNMSQIALDFCYKHGIDSNLADILVQNMQLNLNNNEETNEDSNLNIENSEEMKEVSDLNMNTFEESIDRPKSLADIYNCQKQQHGENIFFQPQKNERFKNVGRNPTTIKKKKNETERKDVFERLFSSTTKNARKNEGEDQRYVKTVKKEENIERVEKVTNRLYKQDLKASFLKRQKYEEIKNKEQLQSMQECTYHPILNPISQLIMEKKTEIQNEPIERSLISRGKNSVLKRDLLRYQSLRKELEACTFQPRISDTRQFSSSQVAGESVFEKLHQESKIKRMKQSLSHKILATEPSTKRGQTDFSSFLERQKAFEFQKKARNEMLANRDLNIDPSSGVPFFRPTTHSKKSSSSNIHEELYQQKNKKAEAIRRLRDKENQELQLKSYKPLMISSKIVQIKRRTTLEEVFRMLDGDKDGLISAENIDISGVESKKLLILAPMFCWMEANGIRMTEEEFVNEGEKFAATLDPYEIRDLFK